MAGIECPALLRLMIEEMLPDVVIDGLADYTNPQVMDNEKPVTEPTLMTPPNWLTRQIKETEVQGDFSQYFPHLQGKKDGNEIKQIEQVSNSNNMDIDVKAARS